MKCCQRQGNRRIKSYRKKNAVYPENQRDYRVKKEQKEKEQEFTADEQIKCGGCQEFFELGSNDLKIHCNLCCQFFHCKIAGKCDGDACKINLQDGSVHRASYCYGCTGLISENKILCKDCMLTTHLNKKL